MMKKKEMAKPAPQFDTKAVQSAEILVVSPAELIGSLGQGDAEGLKSANRGVELVMSITGNSDQARAWLSTPHPDLGGRTARDVILAGRADALVTLLENALAGLPS